MKIYLTQQNGTLLCSGVGEKLNDAIVNFLNASSLLHADGNKILTHTMYIKAVINTKVSPLFFSFSVVNISSMNIVSIITKVGNLFIHCLSGTTTSKFL